MEDDKTKKLAGVLNSKICKKIIDVLSDEELSEKDLSDKLKTPINTIEYNLKKLLEAELIEKSKNFFWSKKGKKIDIYKVSNKSIIISPKSSRMTSKLKSILPAVLIAGIGAVAVKYYSASREIVYGAEKLMESPAGADEAFVESANYFVTAQPFPVWGWFLVGALSVIIIFTILNWRKL